MKCLMIRNNYIHPENELCKVLGCIPYKTEFEDGTPVSIYEEDSLLIHERDLYVTHIKKELYYVSHQHTTTKQQRHS